MEALKEKYAKAKTAEERIKLLYSVEVKADPEQLIEFYNIWAKDYDADIRQFKSELFDMVEKIDEKIDKNAHILDVVSGDGPFGRELKKRGFKHMDALDGSSTMIKMCEASGNYEKTIVAMIRENQPIESIPEGTYDAIICAGGFSRSHLHGGHLKPVMALLKPGGLAVISSTPGNDIDATAAPDFICNTKFHPCLEELKKENYLKMIEKVYLPNCWEEEDGWIWVLQKV